METVILPEFEEKAPYEKGFASHFNTHIKPVLGDLELKRIESYKKFKERRVFGFIAGALSLIFGVGLSILAGDENAILIQISIGIVIAIAAWVYKPVLNYKSEVKSKFLPVICSFFYETTYSINGVSDIESKLEGYIFPYHDMASSEDFIKGKFKEIPFEIHETLLRAKGEKNQSYTVFNGLVIRIEFPKKFKGKTVLLKDGGILGNLFTGKKFHGLSSIALEDPEFEDQFQVFSSDQIESRVLLTTAFMERVLNLAKIGGKKNGTVQAIFQDNELVLAVKSKQNLFEPGNIRQSALNMTDLHTFLEQMNEVFELINILKLDRV